MRDGVRVTVGGKVDVGGVVALAVLVALGTNVGVRDGLGVIEGVTPGSSVAVLVGVLDAVGPSAVVPATIAAAVLV